MTNEHKHFTSSSAFADWMRRTPPAYHEGHGFTAAADVAKGIHTLTHGDLTNLDQAQALIDQFNENIEVPTYTRQLSMAGGFPDVPSYLSGQPEHMWSLIPDTSDRTPLHIYVGLTSSAGVPHDALIKRGCTLAAFALALSNKRPVFITPYVNLGGYGFSHTPDNALISWDITTSPLVLSELMGCLSDPHVTRHAGIAACYRLNPRTNGDWHSDYDNSQRMRQHLGAAPDDLYLPSIHLFDPLLANPIGWIKDNLAKYAPQEDN